MGGTSASYSFPWTAPSPGTYYFDTYAWNADRSQLTRTAVIVVTVANPASQPPQVSAFPSTTFVQAGQAVNFSVSASCVSGLNEMGLESCDSAGNPTGTLALIGASGTFASNTFSWTAPSPGTYYFDAYAWNADRSLRTRTPLMVVTVTAAAAPLQVTSTTSGTSIGVGQQVTFNLSASSGTGLREIGLEQCNAAGATIARIDSASAVGNNWSRAFAWISTGPGTYYFKGYAIDSAGSQTAYTALTTVTVAAPVPVDRTLPATSTAAISYNAARLALFSGGQTVKVDSVTGYILQGRLATGSDQYLYYGPDRFTAFLQNSIIKFADGYVSDGYMDNSGDSVILSYGPDRVAQFYAKSHALFEDGYVSNGYLNYQGTSVSLPYGPGRVTNFYPQSHIKFRDGYVADGFMNNSGSAVTLSYGAGRTTAFLPKAHIKFSGGFVADGYLNGSGSNVLLNFGSTGVASFLPSCHVTFADGYVATGSLSTDGYNTFFRYNPDGSQVTINTQATNIVDGTVDKKKVNDVLKRIHKDWAAIFDFSRFVSTILSDGTIALLDALADGRLIAKLSAADVALQELPIIFADEIPNIPNNYIIHIQYPSVAFAPGADGRGYLVLGQLLQGTLLRTKTGLVSVPAGKTCVFVDGFYVP